GGAARRASSRLAQFHAAARDSLGRAHAAQPERQGRSRGVAGGGRGMKPLGPVPPGFDTIAGELAIAGRTVSELAGGTTPLFVYSAELIRRRMAALRAAMPDQLAIHYAVKANPYHP